LNYKVSGTLLIIGISFGIALLIVNSPDFDSQTFGVVKTKSGMCIPIENHEYVTAHNRHMVCYNPSFNETLNIVIALLGAFFAGSGIVLFIRSHYLDKHSIKQ